MKEKKFTVKKILKQVRDDKYGFTLAEGATQRICTRTERSEFVQVSKTTLLRTVVHNPRHVARQHNKRRAAFTLAEVLITLGIIGVVAVMTMLSLIHKYQEKVRIQQYKKAISLISQAIASQYAANGTYFECYYRDVGSGALDQCTEMFKDIQKYLKVAKYCENNAFDNGCIPDYDGKDTVLKESGKSDEDIKSYNNQCGGYSKNSIKKSSALVLADGTIIVSYSYWGLMAFLLDINGKKGPNKWGYDLFNLQLTRTKGGLSLVPSTLCAQHAEGGLTNTQMHEKAFYGK